MFHRLALTVLLAAVLSLLAACPSSSPKLLRQPQRLDVRGPYTHIGTGMVFPEDVGPFFRSMVFCYDETASGVSAGYDYLDRDGAIAMTVYVYPFPNMLVVGNDHATVAINLEFQAVKDEILRTYPVRFVDQSETTLTQSGRTFNGGKATFAANNAPNVWTQAYLFVYPNHWFVKYRVTAKGYDRPTLDQKVQQFMTALAWPSD